MTRGKKRQLRKLRRARPWLARVLGRYGETVFASGKFLVLSPPADAGPLYTFKRRETELLPVVTEHPGALLRSKL